MACVHQGEKKFFLSKILFLKHEKNIKNLPSVHQMGYVGRRTGDVTILHNFFLPFLNANRIFVEIIDNLQKIAALLNY